LRCVELVVLGLLAASCGDTRPVAHGDAVKARPIASVIRLAGDVRVRHAGASAWVPMTTQTQLGEHDLVQTLTAGSVVLRVTATGGELAMASNTTMQFDALPQAVIGRVVVTIADPLRAAQFQVVTPPGVVVLSADRGVKTEAAIEVEAEATTVELRSGSGAMRHSTGETALAPHRMAFTRDGLVPKRDGLAPSRAATISIHEPADGASLRVRRQVTLDWSPVRDADGYELELIASPLLRRTVTGKPPATIPIATGDYTWTVHAMRSGQRLETSTPHTFHVVVDDRAPVLALTAPAEGELVQGPQLRITGTTEPGAIVEVAKTRLVVDATGAFAIVVPIQRGLSNIVVSALDDLGNRRRVVRSVVWE